MLNLGSFHFFSLKNVSNQYTSRNLLFYLLGSFFGSFFFHGSGRLEVGLAIVRDDRGEGGLRLQVLLQVRQRKDVLGRVGRRNAGQSRVVCPGAVWRFTAGVGWFGEVGASKR